MKPTARHRREGGEPAWSAVFAHNESLSADSQRLHFAIHPHLSAQQVGRFTMVDHRDRHALVTLAGSDIVGVGRYDEDLLCSSPGTLVPSAVPVDRHEDVHPSTKGGCRGSSVSA
ncbi:MAG: hypothetical protein QOJ19_2353 [Acidimicrobiia bacterium]|nr:hypothetical protein [Acidimicrobiia bacterium]